MLTHGIIWKSLSGNLFFRLKCPHTLPLTLLPSLFSLSVENIKKPFENLSTFFLFWNLVLINLKVGGATWGELKVNCGGFSIQICKYLWLIFLHTHTHSLTNAQTHTHAERQTPTPRTNYLPRTWTSFSSAVNWSGRTVRYFLYLTAARETFDSGVGGRDGARG